MLVSGVHQSESVFIYIYICLHSFLRFFFHISHYRVLSRVRISLNEVASSLRAGTCVCIASVIVLVTVLILE